MEYLEVVHPRLQFDRAVAALKDGDTLVITTLDRLGRSSQNMLEVPSEVILVVPHHQIYPARAGSTLRRAASLR